MQAESAQIILVDDHQLLRKGLIKILNANGFTDIIEAANGDELLELLKNTSPDIILLDLYMPKMNGFESIKHIKKVIKNIGLSNLFAPFFTVPKKQNLVKHTFGIKNNTIFLLLLQMVECLFKTTHLFNDAMINDAAFEKFPFLYFC